MDDDDWGLSVEDLDELEKNATSQLASRNKSAFASQPPSQTTSSGLASSIFDSYRFGDATASGHGGKNFTTSPTKNTGNREGGNVYTSPAKNTGNREGGNVYSSPAKNSGKEWKVKVYRDDEPGRIAVESAYNVDLVAVLRTFSGKRWDQSRRVWTYPESELENVVATIRSIPRPQTSLDIDPSLPARVPAESQGCKEVQNDFEGELPGRVRRSLPQFLSSQDSAGQKADRSSQEESEDAGWRTTKAWKGQAVPDGGPSQSPRKVLIVSLVLHSSGKIAARFDYDQALVAAIRKVPKAEWQAKERVWMFPFSSMAEAEKTLSNVTNRNVKVQDVFPLVRRALQATAALPDFEDRFESVPEALKDTLMDFQTEGVRFSLRRGGRVLIADEMGLGKTLQALAVVSCFQEDWPVLIIVPSSLRLNWASMLERWLQIHPTDITVVMSQGGSREGFNIVYTAGKQKVCLDGLFNIVSYDVLSKLEATILDADFKIVIADESHYMKNPNAKRTNACVPLLQRAKYAILLTGTPAISRPIEMFKQLEALQPSVYSRMDEYGNRYCMGSFFGKWQGASHHEELHALVKSTVMIRRLKKDVMQQLPSKRREQVFISIDDSWGRKLRDIRTQLEKMGQERRLAVGEKGGEEATRLDFAERQLLSKLYSDSAEAKLPAVQDYLTTLLEAGCKFLVFGHHLTMLDGIEELLRKKKERFIRIDGKTPASSRLDLVRRFQEQADVTVALLGIRAAGVGLTLTAASTVIFAEMSWTPGDLVQAEDRVHRIGQESAVNICYLHARGSIDDLIWDAVQNKLENLGQVLDGENDISMRVPSDTKGGGQGQETLDAYIKPCTKSSAVSDQQTSNEEHSSPLDTFSQPSNSAGEWSVWSVETRGGGFIPAEDTAVQNSAFPGPNKRTVDGKFKWQEADPECLLTEMDEPSSFNAGSDLS